LLKLISIGKNMSPLLRIFLWGLMISFLGTLPMGTLNIMGMQLSIEEGIKQAYLFSAGVILVEMLYVRISLVGINWVRRQERLMRWMQWITLVIVLALAAGSFIAAIYPSDEGKNVMLQNNIHRTLFGMAMCAINPVQIPFWFGWSTVLFSKNILQPVNEQFNIYIIGIGLGTLLGHTLFIFGGKLVSEKVNNSGAYMNWIIGIIFCATAVLQLYKILNHKGAADKIHEIKDEDVVELPDEEILEEKE
jgi:threonine/homoserine/homoserine lactone efflux protein